MRINELLTEGRESPLYHFTIPENFSKILSTNTLMGRKLPSSKSSEPTISFTRDYTRSFVPGKITSDSFGFRVNQSKLAHNYKISAAVNLQAPDPEKYIAKLPDAYKKEIERMRHTGQYDSGLRVNGTDLKDIAKGTAGQNSRWESEERVIAPQIDDFSSYITGIVLPAGSNETPKKGSLEELVEYLTTKFSGSTGFQLRDQLINAATTLHVPIIWRRQEYDPKTVKSAVIKYYQNRKANQST